MKKQVRCLMFCCEGYKLLWLALGIVDMDGSHCAFGCGNNGNWEFGVMSPAA